MDNTIVSIIGGAIGGIISCLGLIISIKNKDLQYFKNELEIFDRIAKIAYEREELDDQFLKISENNEILLKSIHKTDSMKQEILENDKELLRLQQIIHRLDASLLNSLEFFCFYLNQKKINADSFIQLHGYLLANLQDTFQNFFNEENSYKEIKNFIKQHNAQLEKFKLI